MVHQRFLKLGDLFRRRVQGSEIQIPGAADHVVELPTVQLEGHPGFHQAQHGVNAPPHPFPLLIFRHFQAPEGQGREFPSMGPREVHETPGGEVGRHGLSRLGVDFGPRWGGNGRQFSFQDIHEKSLLSVKGACP